MLMRFEDLNKSGAKKGPMKTKKDERRVWTGTEKKIGKKEER